MIELKPCPYCGRNVRIRTYRTFSEEIHGMINKYYVYCDDCHFQYPELGYTNELELIAAWNRRASGWRDAISDPPKYAELKTEEVLVLLDSGIIISTHYDECIDDDSIFGEWVTQFDNYTLGAVDNTWQPIENVTHWMPLPEPPEKEETKWII